MPQQIELRNIALQAAQPLVHGVSLTLQRGRRCLVRTRCGWHGLRI